LESKIAQSASSKLVKSPRLWLSVDFLSNFGSRETRAG